MSKKITITDPKVIEFFENNEIYEPNVLINCLIKKFVENSKNLEEQNQQQDNNITISKDELKLFYEEYNFFKNQRTTVLGFLKQAHKDSQSNLNRIKFNNLDNFFSKNLNIKKPNYTCDICRIFNVSTAKGLITHKRKCSKMNELKKDNDEEDDEDDEEDDGEEDSQEDDYEDEEASVNISAKQQIIHSQPTSKNLPNQNILTPNTAHKK